MASRSALPDQRTGERRAVDLLGGSDVGPPGTASADELFGIVPASLSDKMGAVSETQSFALVEMVRSVERSPALKKARRFLDFSVGGEPLYPTVLAEGYDTITPLWLDPSLAGEVGQAIDRLLGAAPADAPSERVSVYICSECEDLGCGALTVKLSIDEDLVSWTDWGYQNNYEATIHPVTSVQLRDMQFRRAEYENALETARVGITDGR